MRSARMYIFVLAWIHIPGVSSFLSPAVVTPRTSTQLFENRLWDRLGIEEDPEPFWYLINCVATTELDLLHQCRTICKDMPDAIKFVVPMENKTRSHGAKKMVTETKVKYPGYVFAKLRLCPEVYEAIQGLDLCRSWMGTINLKGNRKLPPVPVALNDMEIENFGLEDLEETELDEEEDDLVENEDGIIIDSLDDDDEDDFYQDPMYKNVDKEALKQYKGLKVEDMVKVIAKNKFYNEDGIVRRLKDGHIFVRFYTYGTMFEEWLDPSDVRKLTAEEIQRGLGGPTEPITQDQFDRRNNRNKFSRDLSERNSGDLRQSLTSSLSGGRFGGGLQRNRRQDRTADRFRSSNDYQTRREEDNWNWYKDKQKKKQGGDLVDDEWRIDVGSTRLDGGDWAPNDANGRWASIKSQRQTRRDRRNAPQHQADIRDTMAAIEGKDDWSSFISSTKESTKQQPSEADDFFASLMTDLDKDLGNARATTEHSGSVDSSSQTDDDFFASLLSEIGEENESTDQKSFDTQIKSDDDFFASLETGDGNKADAVSFEARQSPPALEDFFDQLQVDLDDPAAVSSAPKDSATTADDFFEQLQTEVNSAASTTETSDATSDDFFALLEAELSSVSPSTNTQQPSPSSAISSDEFFDQLQAELSDESFTFDDNDDDGSLVDEREAELFDESFTLDDDDDDASQNKEPSQPSGSPRESFDKSDLSKKTVPILKEMLRERGLKVSGKKAELIERLVSS